jgi:hypothetical protein
MSTKLGVPDLLVTRLVKKVKGHEAGIYSALQLEEADCTLTP